MFVTFYTFTAIAVSDEVRVGGSIASWQVAGKPVGTLSFRAKREISL
jgi:hypothetical protein